MKKYVGLLLIALLFNSCNDGDITVETIDFEAVDALTCGNFLVYKIKGNEALIIGLPQDTNLFTNDPTLLNTPRSVEIGTAGVTMLYRAYSSAATIAGICASPPPITPVAILEWTAVTGSIQVTTTPVYGDPDATTGQSKITQYRHAIIVRGLRFAKPDGTDQIYPSFTFGNYFTNPTNPLNFDFDAEDVKLCPATNTLYNARNSGPEALFIQNFDTANLLSTSNLGVAKTALIGDTANKLVYRYFATNLQTGINESYFCNNITGATTIAEEWIGLNGVSGVSGIIEVTTVANPNGAGFLHTIRLKGVTFKKQNSTSTFYYGNDILYGELITE